MDIYMNYILSQNNLVLVNGKMQYLHMNDLRSGFIKIYLLKHSHSIRNNSKKL